MKLITVIVPVYRAEACLERCVFSIMNQTYSNIELLLIDDGSDDNSLSVCYELALKYENITVLSHANQGVSFTRNIGIEHANGDYLAFVDCDDMVEPDYIRTLYDLSERYADSLASVGIIRIDMQHGTQTFHGYGDVDSVTIEPDFLRFYTDTDFFNSPCNKLYRTQLLREKKIYFHTAYSNGEDSLFNIAYLNYMNKIVYCNRPLYRYYISSEGLHLENKVNRAEIIRQMYHGLQKLEKRNSMVHEKVEQKILNEYLYAIQCFAINRTIPFWKRWKMIREILKSAEFCSVFCRIDMIPLTQNYKRLIKLNSALLICIAMQRYKK